MTDEVATEVPKAGPPGSRTGWAFLSLTRIAIGFIFFWAFIDKLFGLGFSTCAVKDDGGAKIGTDVLCDSAWLSGGRMTEGYLAGSTGPFADWFAQLGTQAWTDWPYMIGLAGIGLALIFGIGTRVALWTGPAMLLMMYISHSWPGAEGPPTTNPFIDDHIVQALAIIGIVLVELTYQSIGLGNWWRRVVGKNTWLV